MRFLRSIPLAVELPIAGALLSVICFVLPSLDIAHASTNIAPGPTREGVYEVRIEEDFIHAPKVTRYIHYKDGHRVEVGLDPKRPEPRPESKVSVASDGTVTFVAYDGTPPPKTFGPNTVLAILVNFADNTAEPFAPAQAQAVFDDASAFHREESYGQTWLVPTATSRWYTIPISASLCSLDQIRFYAAEAAKADGINTDIYDRVSYLIPGTACSFGGVAQVGGRDSWMKTVDRRVVTHELGHNYGVWHSNSFVNCGTSIIGGTCVHYEYGDRKDVQGNGTVGQAAHMTAFQKEILGWLDYGASPQIQDVTVNGTYSLSPYEAGSGVKALRILKEALADGSRVDYFVEFRTPIGYDTFLQTPQVLIHTGNRPTYSSSSYLLDMSPSDNTTGNAQLLPGSSYIDPAAGVTIRTVAVSSGQATVDVAFGAAPPTPPPTATWTPTPVPTRTPTPIRTPTPTKRCKWGNSWKCR